MSKRIISAALACLLLVGCRTVPPSQPELTIPQPEASAQTLAQLSLSDLRLISALYYWDVTGMSGNIAFGYKDSEFGFSDDRGREITLGVFDRDSVEGKFIQAADFGGTVYGIFEYSDASGSTVYYLFNIEKQMLNLLDEIPCDVKQDVSIKLCTRGGINVLVNQRHEDGGTVFCTSSAYSYSKTAGLVRLISEESSETFGEKNTEGVRILDLYSDGGSLFALGYGKRDGKHVYVLNEYSSAMTFMSSTDVVSFEDGGVFSEPEEDMRLYPLNGCFALCGSSKAAVISDRIVEYDLASCAWLDGCLIIGGTGDMKIFRRNADGSTYEEPAENRLYIYTSDSPEPLAFYFEPRLSNVAEGLIEAGDSALLKLRNGRNGTNRYYRITKELIDGMGE